MLSRLAILTLLLTCLIACSRDSETPISQRAMAAYNAKDYKTALPLLKQWGTQVGNRDPQYPKIVECIVDSEQKLGKNPEMPTTTIAAATAPATQESPAIASDALIDPSTNKPRIPHHAPSPGEIPTFPIKKLGNFPFDPNHDADVPADVHLLDGKKVRVRGYILAFNQADKITDFGLVPSLFNCCFGKAPGPEHVITCRTKRPIEYLMDEVVAEGTLKVNVKREDNYTYSIFELDITSLKVAE